MALGSTTKLTMVLAVMWSLCDSCSGFTSFFDVRSWRHQVVQSRPSSTIARPLSSASDEQPVAPLLSEDDDDDDDEESLKSTFFDTLGESLQQEPEEDDLHWFRFAGIGQLYHTKTTNNNTEEAVLERMQQATVAVVGLGGIGSWAAESLGRSGIGHLVLIDLDDVCISHTNRQLHTMSDNVGQLKTIAMGERLRALQPALKVTLIHDFVMTDTAESILESIMNSSSTNGGKGLAAVIDTMDGPDEKAALWKACAKHKIPLVACGSAEGRRDPTQIVCGDLSSLPKNGAGGDALLCQARESLLSSVPQASPDANLHIPCVYAPMDHNEDVNGSDDQRPDHVPSFRSVANLGTASFVSGSMGFTAVSRVVEGIAWQTLEPPSIS